MWHAREGMGWWMAFGGLLWLMVWGAVIYLIVKASGDWRHADRGGTSRGDEPVEIARRRYAAGEITKEQYEQLRSDLVSRAA